MLDWNTIIIATIGTALAAYAGAFAAQQVIENTRSKEALITEIRNANAAIMIAFSIFNFFFGLKKQHVKRLKENYDNQREQCLRHMNGQLPNFWYAADLSKLSPPSTPIKELQTQIFEKVSLKGLGLLSVMTLAQVIHSLSDTLQLRNDLIANFRSGKISKDEVHKIYFGLAIHEYDVDTTYPDVMQSIYENTDDCIYFSYHLCEDLVMHAEKLKSKLKDRSIRINKPQFAEIMQSEFMPDLKQYENFERMYQEQT